MQQQRKITGLEQSRTELLHPCDVLEALAQLLLSVLARCDVVETVDGSGDVSASVLQRSNIDDDGNRRAVGPLDDDLAVTQLRQGAGHDFGMGHCSCGMYVPSGRNNLNEPQKAVGTLRRFVYDAVTVELRRCDLDVWGSLRWFARLNFIGKI